MYVETETLQQEIVPLIRTGVYEQNTLFDWRPCICEGGQLYRGTLRGVHEVDSIVVPLSHVHQYVDYCRVVRQLATRLTIVLSDTIFVQTGLAIRAAKCLSQKVASLSWLC